MKGGESTSVGIVFYDTDKNAAVFCSFRDGKPFFKTGTRKEIFDEMKKADFENKKDLRKAHNKIMLGMFLVLIGFIASVWIFAGGFFAVSGAFAFSVISYFPLLVLAFAMKRNYGDEEIFHQFRRFHGAEHMVISYSGKKKPSWEIDDIRKTSYFHRECGTVYAAEAIVFAAIFGIFFALIPEIGFFRFLAAVFISLILLFLNLFNPYNPLMLFQAFAVEKPKDEEILLAAEGIKILDGIE